MLAVSVNGSQSRDPCQITRLAARPTVAQCPAMNVDALQGLELVLPKPGSNGEKETDACSDLQTRAGF